MRLSTKIKLAIIVPTLVVGVSCMLATIFVQRIEAQVATQLTLLIAGGGVLAATAIALAEARRITQRLEAIAEAANRIGTGDFNVDLRPEANDELDHLVRCFVRMAEQLREAQERRDKVQKHLVEVAHKVGAAEVANGVLHNVGNVLNSIEVSASMIAQEVTDPPCRKWYKVTQLLNEHKDDLATFLTRDQRGRRLIEYMDIVKKLFERHYRAMDRALEKFSQVR